MNATLSHRNDSTASTSPVDSAIGHGQPLSSQQVPYGSLSLRKTRTSPVALSPIPQPQITPKKQLRRRRSISSDVDPPVSPSPTRTSDEIKRKPVQRRPSEPVSSPTKLPTGLRMLSSTFHKGNEIRKISDQPQTMSNHAPSQQSGYSPMATFNLIHDTTNKRMATLDYLRKVHEGQVYYFSTISYNPSCISSIPSMHPSRLGRRATNYLLLGTSMTPLLEYYSSNPLDYLRALASLLAEFDTYNQYSMSENGSMSLARGRMGAIFKRGTKSKRTSSAAESLQDMAPHDNSASISGLSSLADSMPLPPVHSSGHEFQYLQVPSLPFDPDFNTSFATLTDILMEAYSGLLSLLPSPESCVPGVAEAFAKTDKQMRKVMFGGIITEFGESTRIQAKTEVGGLSKLVLSGLM